MKHQIPTPVLASSSARLNLHLRMSLLIQLPNPLDNWISSLVQYHTKSRCTAMATLPNELLWEIFLWTSSTYSKDSDRKSCPLNLTQTCRTWRKVAINTPTLWTVIVPSPKSSPEIIQLWVDRSADFFLVLSLEGLLLQMEPVAERNVVTILSILFSSRNASRIRQLYLPDVCPATFGILCGDPSLLRNLRQVVSVFRPRPPRTYPNIDNFWAVARAIPSLRVVTLAHIPPKGPWEQLTTVHLVSPPFHAALGALSHCQQLATLLWKSMDPKMSINDPLVTLPRLTHFVVHFARKIDPSLFFGNLILPSLFGMTIQLDVDMPNVLIAWEKLLVRSKAKLYYFKMSSASVARHGDKYIDPFLLGPAFAGSQGYTYDDMDRADTIDVYIHWDKSN